VSDTQDRRERSAKLHAALEEYLEGQGFEGMLGDWLVVGAVVRIDEDGDPDATYFTAMTGGSMLQHIALGLLAKAEDALVSPDEESDD
jgi:hypothetical protein